MDRLKNRAGLQEAFEPELKKRCQTTPQLGQMRQRRTERRMRGGFEVRTDEVAGDRVRGVGGDGRGEAGQKAEQGDEPEFTEETKRNISGGSNGRRLVVAGPGCRLLPSDRLEGVVADEVELRRANHGCRVCRRPAARVTVWLWFQQVSTPPSRAEPRGGPVRLVLQVRPGRSSTPLGVSVSCTLYIHTYQIFIMKQNMYIRHTLNYDHIFQFTFGNFSCYKLGFSFF